MSKPVAPTRADAMSAGKQVIESGQLERRLTDLVALRTESQDPAQTAVLEQYLREMMRPMLLEMGFDVALHDNPVLKAPPLLLARSC
jgi:hypothetical protein